MVKKGVSMSETKFNTLLEILVNLGLIFGMEFEFEHIHCTKKEVFH